MLQDRINKIKEYFRGMEITNNTYIIKVAYKDKWGVFPSEDNNIKVCKSEDAINEFFYYANYTTVNIEDIFNLIEETIEMNISAEIYFAFQETSNNTKKKRKKKKNSEENNNKVDITADVIENENNVQIEKDE